MMRSIPSKISPQFLSGGGTPPPVAVASSGILAKSPYGYLARDGADVASLNYQQDWSMEVILDLPIGGMRGYYNDIVRHGDSQTAIAVNGKAGWTLGLGNFGYDGTSAWSFAFVMSDGGSPAKTVDWYSPNKYFGKTQVIVAWNATTKTLVFYTNGSTADYGYGTTTNATISMPSSIAKPLTIGSYNFDAAGTTATATVALPEFNAYVLRLWQSCLTSTHASTLWNHWNGTGRTTIPGTVPAPFSAFYFHEEVGDKNGIAGTGWVKDSVGTNHLKFVSTNGASGASGYASSVTAPSGSVRIVTPASGATSVSGAVKVKASGLFGTGEAMQYYIECDEVNTFNGANLRNSGWLYTDGTWQPGFKPSTTYYLRVKCRSGVATGTESSWSSTSSFTTRAAATYYVRPLNLSAGYGTGAGTSYANAFNGFRHFGQQGGRSALRFQEECDLRNIAPGDTVKMCDKTWGILESASITESSILPRTQIVCGQGLPTHPIDIRLDDGTNPGEVYLFRRYTGSYSWTNEGGGVYSTATYDSGVDRIAFDNGAGLPDMGTELQDKVYYKQASGPLTGAGWYVSSGRMYVRLPDDSNPVNKIWTLGGYGEISIYGSQHIKFSGGAWYGTTPQVETVKPSINATFININSARLKYHTKTYGLHAASGCDDWTIDGCTISYMQNGVYGANSGPSAGTNVCANRWTVKNNWFHHIGVATSGAWTEDDSHCVGWQAGEDWIVEDNLCEFAGSAIEQWGFQYKYARGSKIRRNVIRKITQRRVTFGAGIAFTGGDLYELHRANCEVKHNVCMDTDGPGVHSSTGDTMPVYYNLLINNGLYGEGVNYDDYMWHNWSSHGCPSSRPCNVDIQYNVMVNPYQKSSGVTGKFIKGGGNGAGAVTINNNLYWDAAPVDATTAGKFQFAGIGSGTYSFDAWKALGVADQNSYFENPLTSAHVPAGFDDLMIKGFCRSVLCDFDGDGSVTAADLTYFDAYAAGNGPRIAARKLLQNLITYGAY